MNIPTYFTLLSLVCHASWSALLNHTQLLAAVENPAWFKANIPIIQVPSPHIQEIYYYRWQTYKEHLVYSGPQYGYLSSEFLHPVFYGAPYGGIVAAAGHHITEGRWLRNVHYGQDIVNYWLSGPGQSPKPATEELNKDTYDWAHEYSFWAADAVWRQYLVTGDKEFVIGQLENLVVQYRGWDNHFNSDLGLYWQVPVWDATEYTAASYESDDPYHGGAGYRPTINAYQYGDALAISSIAALKGDARLRDEYKQRAEALQTALIKHLWHKDKRFFMHRARDNNPTGNLLTAREIMGYLPWAFNMPPRDFDTTAFAQLRDYDGFAARYGPTTAEQRSKWFMHEADGCCRWNGPSWPFATAQTLTAVENLLHNYPHQDFFTAFDYVNLLERYASTQYKDGKPYVAEAHHPKEPRWMYDGFDHSEDYNHSTFVDNVLSGLLGLRPQPDNTLVINPLVPPSWAYFAVENASYHGRSISIIWDRSGSQYNQGKGLRVYVDGNLVGHRDDIGSLTVDVSSAAAVLINAKVNIASNAQRYPQLAQAFASYTSGFDDAMRVVDGNIWRTQVPGNSRWTSHGSRNTEDHIGIDFGQPQSISDVRLFFYDDGGGVRVPSSYDVQYWTGRDWATVPNQKRTPAPKTSNEETEVTFPTLRTSQLRVIAPNPGSGRGWGLPKWNGKLIGVERMSMNAGARVQQYEDNGTRDHHWLFTRVQGGWYNIKNLQSGLILAVDHASMEDSANLIQYKDTGAQDHLWRVEARGGGLFLIRNKNSRKVAGVDRMSTANSANVVQFDDNGTRDHMWVLLPATAEE